MGLISLAVLLAVLACLCGEVKEKNAEVEKEDKDDEV